MAEFQEVAKAYIRMCDSFGSTCNGCPIYNIFDVDSCRARALKDPDKYERAITAWAADHPEPKYPTWAEYLNSIGVTISDRPFPAPNIPVYVYQAGAKMFAPIPADIAQKLGMQPKEG